MQWASCLVTQELASAKTPKGEQTRALILKTALDLFEERGYEGTTMRAIAETAGVSLSHAYYYFHSKEELIQGFYQRVHEAHLAACQEILAHDGDLHARLLGVLNAKLDVSTPYHRFCGIIFKNAADPQSPLSPFGPESNAWRQESTAIFTQVVTGSRTHVPADLQAELPNLLWLYHMGIVLYWLHDNSPNQVRSYRLAERTAALVAQLIPLASHPLMRPFRRAALQVLAELRSDPDEPRESPRPTNEGEIR
jgi:AcrR family transcriptional regulator